MSSKVAGFCRGVIAFKKRFVIESPFKMLFMKE